MSNGRWSRIDEAPRDGTAILVCSGSLINVAYFSEDGGTWRIAYTDEEYGNRVMLNKPKWWMPLPEPPKVK